MYLCENTERFALPETIHLRDFVNEVGYNSSEEWALLKSLHNLFDCVQHLRTVPNFVNSF